MERALIVGTGNNFIFSCASLEANYNVIGLADNSDDKQGKRLFGYIIRRPEEYNLNQYDIVIITPNSSEKIRRQMIDLGVSKERILNLDEALEKNNCDNPVKIAILLYGGMGDCLIGKNWIYHLRKQFGIDKEEIHLFSDQNLVSTVNSLFSDCKSVLSINSIDYNHSSLVDEPYDLVFRFSIFPYVQFLNDEKVFRRNKNLYMYADELRRFGFKNYNYGFFSSPSFHKTVKNLFSKYPTRKYHTHFDVLENLNANDVFLCAVPINISEEKYLQKLELQKKQFITIDTGLNEEYASKKNTRAWIFERWNDLANMIKEKYQNYKIVQMGLSSGCNEDINADMNLNGKTNLDQAKVLLKNSLLHIDYEGGLIHLRHALNGGPSIVIMGPTTEAIHNYPENIAIRSSICTEACEWSTKNWLEMCPKGYDYPLCMEAINSKMVFKEVEKVLDNQ